MCCASSSFSAGCETVSHPGKESLAGLPVARLLLDPAVLRGTVGGLQLSVVCGQHQSATVHSHLWKSQRKQEAAPQSVKILNVLLLNESEMCVDVCRLTDI